MDTVKSTETSDIVTGASMDRWTSIIPTTTYQADKDEASTSKDISSIIKETSTATIVSDENMEVTAESCPRIPKLGMRP